jgi:hypothetical protein
MKPRKQLILNAIRQLHNPLELCKIICILLNFLPKGCHLDVVGGLSTPHDPKSDAERGLSSEIGLLLHCYAIYCQMFLSVATHANQGHLCCFSSSFQFVVAITPDLT